MDELEKKQMELCLECKMLHDVIADYDELYDDLYEAPVNRTEKEKEEFERKVCKLAEKLNIRGTFQQKCSGLKNLSNYEETDDELPYKETCDGYRILPYILTFLSPFMSHSLSDVPDKKPYAKIIYSKLYDLNMHFAENYDGDPVEKILQNLYNKNYIDKNNKRIKEVLIDMYLSYLDIEKLEDKPYCNYKGNAFLSAVKEDFQNRQKCQNDFDVLSAKVAGLSVLFQTIVWDFIKYAPKRFGNILSMVMNLQEMNETDIARLLDIKPNRVQAFQKNIEPPKDKDTILLLSRTLLVSEDVLSCGYGHRYGNWNSLFRKEEIEDFIEKGKELKLTNAIEVKNWLRRNIHKFTEMKQGEFEKFVEENSPKFFCTEEINIFKDIKSAYEELLDKKAVYTLLDVLIRLDKGQ